MKPSCSPTPRAAIKKAQARYADMDVTHGAAAESEMAAMEADGDDETKEKRAAAAAAKGKS